MKISVKVKAGSKKSIIIKTEEREFSANLKAPAKEGKANRELISLLSDFFHISQSKISIIKGASSKNKIIEIG